MSSKVNTKCALADAELSIDVGQKKTRHQWPLLVKHVFRRHYRYYRHYEMLANGISEGENLVAMQPCSTYM